MNELKIKLRYTVNNNIVCVRYMNVDEKRFKLLICDLLIDLPFQLYVYENNYWDFDSLDSYDNDSKILVLRGLNSNVLVEVLKG